MIVFFFCRYRVSPARYTPASYDSLSLPRSSVGISIEKTPSYRAPIPSMQPVHVMGSSSLVTSEEHPPIGHRQYSHGMASGSHLIPQEHPVIRRQYVHDTGSGSLHTPVEHPVERRRVKFDPFTGEPYKFDPFTGEPIRPEPESPRSESRLRSFSYSGLY